jgi:hypothetical protein
MAATGKKIIPRQTVALFLIPSQASSKYITSPSQMKPKLSTSQPQRLSAFLSETVRQFSSFIHLQEIITSCNTVKI